MTTTGTRIYSSILTLQLLVLSTFSATAQWHYVSIDVQLSVVQAVDVVNKTIRDSIVTLLRCKLMVVSV